jgi:transposase
MRQKRTPRRQGALRPMADPDVSGGAALRPAHRAVRHRRAINGASFRAYVEQLLLPALTPGDIVVMENLGSHKGRAVRAAVHVAKANLFFLPAYAPDLNPIEQAFAKMKTLLRKADARTIDETWRSIDALLDCFTQKECANYFTNAGYASA